MVPTCGRQENSIVKKKSQNDLSSFYYGVNPNFVEKYLLLYSQYMDTGWIFSYPEESIVRRAFLFAENAHKDVTRASGEPYIIHPLAVANFVREWGLDEKSIAAALLHDVIEDTSYTQKDLEKIFGAEIAEIVDGMTKLRNFKYGENPDAENIRKLILSFGRDLRVILIKLADRYHNMMTLKYKSPEKQKEIAWETIEIYAPIAYRLGMQKLSGELEDLSFPFLYEEEYRWLVENIKEQHDERVLYAEKLKFALHNILEEAHIKPIAIDSRAKRYYSLYRKLMRNDMDLDKIYDLVAVRVIVNTVEECYGVLGVIHKHWSPLPRRFRDYIAVPKSNGYRSLHTIVSALENRITEIQIKTEEMHQENEFGIAAHWAYEQTKKDPTKKTKGWRGVQNKKELLWVQQLQNWQNKFGSQQDFLESLKVDFFKERIFVLTPKNDVIDLPAQSTPIDFAYRIHSEIGNQCTGAKVNEKIVPLDYELHSGDVIEVSTQKGKKPSEDWLRFIKSSMAKKYVRSSLRTKDRKLQTKISAPKEIQFKIANIDRPGYLREITNVFGDLDINILFLNSQTDPRNTFSTVIVKCGIVQKQKLAKLLMKIKKIEGTKEISYHYI